MTETKHPHKKTAVKVAKVAEVPAAEAPSVPVQTAVAQAPVEVSSPATVAEPATPPEQDEKFFAALGYLAVLFVVPLVAKPKSEYCKFHARQSMVMFLGTIIVLVVLAAIPWFGSLLTMSLFALYVLAIYRSYMGDLWRIPLVSGLADKIDLDTLYGKAGTTMTGIAGMKDKAESMATKVGDSVKKSVDSGNSETK